ncbi:TetR/AcrR family transcriptional regulator [Amnibacterium kyonggiense]|uniref:TetR family transcriptional regulator n=1 Tax=Amnibacterium kyonggiense TaxID=595671 RepID=A0A4R7FLM7_9MICO|nr:TetR/AcrR family transcriptional regulator [Amnibacterium kyonggiense]TDS77279.1 TetR family transcriptional regulator [Amnibacterium kyonggiense]
MTQLDTVPLSEQTEDDGGHRLGRKRDHTRDPEILDAALDVLAETGYDAMSMDLVAARAKAGKATLYRRWPSKADLVIDAVTCMKQAQSRIEDLPDTGTLRGDLVALIRPHSMEEAERKMRVMGAVVSMLSRDPGLADAVNEAITEPRARLNRALIERAIARGEVSPRVDVDTVAHISPSMVAYRTLVQRKPVDREYLISLIDGVVLPALGLPAGAPA